MDEAPHSAREYRKRAAEVRAEAQQISNPETRKTLLEVAERYERLANTLDANARRRS